MSRLRKVLRWRAPDPPRVVDRPTAEVVADLCPHLRPLLDRALDDGARLVAAWESWGFVVLVDALPELGPDDAPVYGPVHENLRDAGWSRALTCPEHRQHLAVQDRASTR